ncbi:MAG: flagellar hook-basal body protein [Xanthomonadales bacterium]|nr:flagellar hook-basal body protein [Xanthomonadales bacterium]
MIDALYISASGLRSDQKQIDVTSNNVANIHTPGFKRSRVNFVEVASAMVDGGAAPADAVGDGTRVHSTSTLFDPGDLRATRNPLDLAIDGAGFFEFESESGEPVYSRDGQFRIDAEGYLVSVQGLRTTQPIQIPAGATDVAIAPNGDVTAKLDGGTERSMLGTLELATFAAADALVQVGDNRFKATDAAGAVAYGRPGDAGFGRLQSGYVEMANVDLVDEMTTLVLAQRSYQLNARVLQAADQILETINNLRR